MGLKRSTFFVSWKTNLPDEIFRDDFLLQIFAVLLDLDDPDLGHLGQVQVDPSLIREVGDDR